jgi:hypothetical protein
MAAAVWTACTKLLFVEKSGAPERAVLLRGFAVYGHFRGGFWKSWVFGCGFCGGELWESHGGTWWIAWLFWGAKNMPLNFKFLVEISKANENRSCRCAEG